MYYGQYKILRKTGLVAYELDLPSDSRINKIFHVSLLKPFVGEAPSVIETILENMLLFNSQPSAITYFRWCKINGTKVYKMLIEWTNASQEEATWES